MTIKETVKKCVEDKRIFAIMCDSYVFNDALFYDVESDEDAVHIICKYVTSAFMEVKPTFGTRVTNTGLQEIIIPYEKINAVSCLDIDSTLLAKFKSERPELYNKWEKANYAEGCSIPGSVPTKKSKAVREYEETHQEEIEKKNRKDAIGLESYGELDTVNNL